MSKAESLTYTIKSEIAALINEAVSSGDYDTDIDVLADALLDWRDKREQQKALATRQLEALLEMVQIIREDARVG